MDSWQWETVSSSWDSNNSSDVINSFVQQLSLFNTLIISASTRTLWSTLEMGKNVHCWGSVLFGFQELFGSVRILMNYSQTGLQFCSGSLTTEIRYYHTWVRFEFFWFLCIQVPVQFGSLKNKDSSWIRIPTVSHLQSTPHRLIYRFRDKHNN